MPEVRAIGEYAGWYRSYLDDQGDALIKCMELKIEAQNNLIAVVLAEIELTDSPREVTAEVILESIKNLLTNQEVITHTKGYFTWTA